MQDSLLSKLRRALTPKKRIELAESRNVDRLHLEMDKFFQLALPDVEAWFTTDESRVWDFNCDDGTEVLQLIRKEYGVEVSTQDLDLYLWQLVEELNSRRLALGWEVLK